MTEVRIIFAGSREWRDYSTIAATMLSIRDYLAEKGAKLFVIEGRARGADLTAERVAILNGIPYQGFPAQWKKFGKAAGPIRNEQMLVEGRADGTIAFHDDITHSRGTRHMIDISAKRQVPFTLYTFYGHDFLDKCTQHAQEREKNEKQ